MPEQTTEIVRCFQCIHRGGRLEVDGKVLVGCYLMKEDDFCSHAKKRPGLKYTPKGTKQGG